MNALFVPCYVSFKTREAALQWAKFWRSDCIDFFSECEQELGQLLRCLAAKRWLASKVKLKQPTGPSFAELRKHLSSKGHWRTERTRLNKTLDAIERFWHWRADVTHGVLDVWPTKSGGWLVILRRPDGHCANPVRWYAYPFAEASLLLDELRIETRRFRANGEAFRVRIGDKPNSQSLDQGGTLS